MPKLVGDFDKVDSIFASCQLAFDSVAKSSSCRLSWVLAITAREELNLLQELFFAIADPDSEQMNKNQLVHAASNYVGEQVRKNYLTQMISEVECRRVLNLLLYDHQISCATVNEVVRKYPEEVKDCPFDEYSSIHAQIPFSVMKSSCLLAMVYATPAVLDFNQWQGNGIPQFCAITLDLAKTHSAPAATKGSSSDLSKESCGR